MIIRNYNPRGSSIQDLSLKDLLLLFLGGSNVSGSNLLVFEAGAFKAQASKTYYYYFFEARAFQAIASKLLLLPPLGFHPFNL